MTSYYEGLPIYGGDADLVVLLPKVVSDLSRLHKDSFGTRLRGSAVDIVVRAVTCNRREERSRLSGDVRAQSLCWWLEPLPYQDRVGQLLLLGITAWNRGEAR